MRASRSSHALLELEKPVDCGRMQADNPVAGMSAPEHRRRAKSNATLERSVLEFETQFASPAPRLLKLRMRRSAAISA